MLNNSHSLSITFPLNNDSPLNCTDYTIQNYRSPNITFPFNNYHPLSNTYSPISTSPRIPARLKLHCVRTIKCHNRCAAYPGKLSRPLHLLSHLKKDYSSVTHTDVNGFLNSFYSLFLTKDKGYCNSRWGTIACFFPRYCECSAGCIVS